MNTCKKMRIIIIQILSFGKVKKCKLLLIKAYSSNLKYVPDNTITAYYRTSFVPYLYTKTPEFSASI